MPPMEFRKLQSELSRLQTRSLAIQAELGRIRDKKRPPRLPNEPATDMERAFIELIKPRFDKAEWRQLWRTVGKKYNHDDDVAAESDEAPEMTPDQVIECLGL